MKSKINIVTPTNGRPAYIDIAVGENMNIELRGNKLYCYGWTEDNEELPAYPDGYGSIDYPSDLDELVAIHDAMIEQYNT